MPRAKRRPAEDTSSLRWMSVAELEPWDRNPRRNDKAVEPVARSILRFGFVAPVVLWAEAGRLVAGHTRLKAVRFLQQRRPVLDEDGRFAGWEPRPDDDPYHVVAGYQVDGTPVLAPEMDQVPVRHQVFRDQAEADAYALADNKLGELADWDEELLAEEMQSLAELEVELDGLGWSEDELNELTFSGVNAVDPAEETPGALDLPEKPDSIPGQVYELGPHRLICGDCTEDAVWTELMGTELARAMWTDPPYGIDYVGKTANRLEIIGDSRDVGELQKMLEASFNLALRHTRKGAAWYVAAPQGPNFLVFGQVLREAGVWRWTLQWVKDRFVLGRADYHFRHEPIFYGWNPGGSHYFADDRTQDSVFEVPRPSASAEHPTMKPVELVRQMLVNSTRAGWLVVDPFAGSGSTLIACHALGLRGRMIEKDPRYCDVIRRRWTAAALASGVDPGSGALAEKDPAT